MKSAAVPLFGRRFIAALALSVLAAGAVQVLPLYGTQDSGRTRQIAETQHEIVMLLIKKKEFQKAADEAHKIFEMKWAESQEPILLRSLLIISGEFLRSGQPSLGLQVVDKNSKCFKQVLSRIAILKEMGYLYKTMNQDDRAIECFRKARELENKE